MKGWRYALLIFELFLFALILVLPQVDLPDFTFPGGTAPIAARSRLSPPSAFSVVLGPVHGHSLEHVAATRTRAIHPAFLSPFSPVTLPAFFAVSSHCPNRITEFPVNSTAHCIPNASAGVCV